uniref:uncharacterized protein isoform X1 n=1 Tax=Myxine glutinosa TaxID=7769 RepID=UPI00358E1410
MFAWTKTKPQLDDKSFVTNKAMALAGAWSTSAPFPTWLQGQGLSEDAVRAMIADLGIKSHDALRACAEPVLVRTELFLVARERLPFAMYVEIRRFVESLWEPPYSEFGSADLVSAAGSSPLLAVLCSMMNGMIQELSSCAQKLNSLSNTGRNNARLSDTTEDSNPAIRGFQEFCHQNDASETEPVLMDNLKNEPRDWEQEITKAKLEVEAEEQGNSGTRLITFIDDTIESCKRYSRPETTDEQSSDLQGSTRGRPVEHGRQLFLRRQQEVLGMDELQVDVPRCYQSVGNKKHKCNHCPYSSNNVGHFQAHLRIHTGERPYKCSACGKAFTQSSVLQTHMRVHTGEKPYKCTACEKTFAHLHSLQTHTRIHTGEKPYMCSSCGKAFTHSTTLRNHMRTAACHP